jgi:hypothetical protein
MDEAPDGLNPAIPGVDAPFPVSAGSARNFVPSVPRMSRAAESGVEA